jgi:hypothetical protein
MASMIFLALGICLDVYLISRVILGTSTVAIVVAVLLLGVFLVFWRVLPQKARRGWNARDRIE